ncbi:DUF971 domain-containing protein [Fibrobacter sp.]|uniref:DUF971 domain-containing protein n=1 Tax=Fibrobacter sp. TaxID=35828 RepID=UPI0025BE980B|nr:DUF971 domain-containing protein [Fibrobacter sp.]MBQ9226765.1 DUF971 domain-containing protein [Fibrobacter sp.]
MIQPKKIFRTKDGRLGFEWSDGMRSVYTIRELRLACPCALCVDEHTGEKLLDETTVSADIKLTRAQSIGRYAVGLTFSDGHNSGIYPYDKLKELTKKA